MITATPLGFCWTICWTISCRGRNQRLGRNDTATHVMHKPFVSCRAPARRLRQPFPASIYLGPDRESPTSVASRRYLRNERPSPRGKDFQPRQVNPTPRRKAESCRVRLASPHPTPRKVTRTNCSLQTCNGGGGPRSPYVGYACWTRTAIAANFDSQCADGNPVLQGVCRYVSRFLLGHSFGASPAPGGTRSSASRSAPLWGHGSSQNKFENHGKKRRANFFWAPPCKQTFGTWEQGPLARLRP